MLSTLIERFAVSLIEGGDCILGILSDYLEEYDEETLSELIRRYLDIQTKIRMSEELVKADIDAFVALNNSFNMPKRDLHVGFHYSSPLGPWYTSLTVTQKGLYDNLNLMSAFPIRHLILLGCQPNDDLALILRNYRVSHVYTLQLNFQRCDPSSLANIVKQMKTYNLRDLSIVGLNDRLNLVKTAFVMNTEIQEGVRLLIANRTVCTKGKVSARRLIEDFL